MLLGIISFIFFLIEQALVNESEIEVEHFELAHYVLFATGISFAIHAVAIYMAMGRQFRHWAGYESALQDPSVHFAALSEHAASGLDKNATRKAQNRAEWAVVRSAYVDR